MLPPVYLRAVFAVLVATSLVGVVWHRSSSSDPQAPTALPSRSTASPTVSASSPPVGTPSTPPRPTALTSATTTPTALPLPDRADRANPSFSDTPLVQFTRWLAERGPDPNAWTAEEIREGLQRAGVRREALRRLIPLDPRAALQAALPFEQRLRLPEVFRPFLEEPFAAKGRLEVLCPAPALPGMGRSPSQTVGGWIRTFTSGDRTLQAYVYGRRRVQQTTAEATLHGIVIDDLFAVDEPPTRPLSDVESIHAMNAGRVPATPRCGLTGALIDPAKPLHLAEYGEALMAFSSAAAAAEFDRRLAVTEPGFLRPTESPEFRQWSHGTKRLLFMRARFPDDLREPISEAEAAEVMRQANDYFVAASYNNLSVISTIGPLVTLPQPKLYYAARGPGALMRDARDVTRRAGVDTDAFDLDMVRFESVPGFDWGGLGAVGGKGTWLQGSGLGVICHELGHNLGLGHANFWNTARPEPPADTQNLPFDTDSQIGLDSITGPGDDIEYGDPFDIMGSGGGAQAHYTALHKTLLGWIPASGIRAIRESGVYRLTAHDTGALEPGATYALRVRKDVERDYWISARSRFPGNPWLSRGVELHWNQWHQAIGSCELLDTTPGSGPAKDDAALTLGRTFADPEAGVFITPLRQGLSSIGNQVVPFYEVLVTLGASPTNQPPSLQLSASALQTEPGQPVTFSASASDPNGDPIAYAWDLGEGQPGFNEPTQTTSWATSGDYVVRCEVTDGRGGTASRHLVVRVGRVASLRVTGQVIDQSGFPLAGVRVHNGLAGTNSLYAEDYRWAYTDSDGRYTLTGLLPGSYGVGAFLGGYSTRPLNFIRPLILDQFTGVSVDFIATALPSVSVATFRDGAESPATPAIFRLTRTGPTNDTLRVYFRTAGAATDTDYTPWPDLEIQTNTITTVLGPVAQTLEVPFVDLGPGTAATNLTFPVTPDSLVEGPESLVLTLVYPVGRTVITETETNSFDIPGWEVLSDNGQDTWFQTRPAYWLGPLAEATARLLDSSPTLPTTLSVVALDPEVSENPGETISFLITRLGADPGRALRIPLQISGTATPGDDFERPPIEIELAAGTDALRLTWPVFEDLRMEGAESAQLTLGPGDGFRLGNATATVEIIDNDLPLLTVTALDPILHESAPGARVAFQRSGDLSRALDVDYLLRGTAIAGSDYLAPSGRIPFPPGASTATLVLVPINDSAFEGDETIEIQIGDNPTYNAAAPSQALVILRDDEAPSVTVEALTPETAEGGEPGVFLIRRTGPTSTPLTVRYRLGGSAIHQADYVASGNEIVLERGRAAVALQISPIDDALREDDETIDIELLPDPAYSLGSPAQAALRLLDNNDSDLGVGFALLASSGPESKSEAELAVRISGNPDEGEDQAVTVAWEILGGTARNTVDYLLTNGTLTFTYSDPEGDEPLTNRIAFIPLQILDDALVEPDETLLVRLRIAPTELPSEDPEAPPTLVTNGLLDVFSVHTYTILDDDRAVVGITPSTPAVVEGSGIPARFTLTRSGPTHAPQSVTLFLSGLAAEGSDYSPIPRAVVIPAGQRTLDLPIHAIDDPVAEYREDVVVTLVDAPGATLGTPRQASVHIDDNDGTLEFAVARSEVSEDAGVARVLVRRSGPVDLPATALFRTVAGTAQPALNLPDPAEASVPPTGDFLATNGVVAFAPGDRTREIEIRILQDDLIEGPESLTVLLAQGSDLFPLGGQDSTVLTILDDDALLSTGTNTPAGLESAPDLEITVERSGPVSTPLRLTFQTADATAIAGQDFLATEGILDFPAGARSAVLRIPLLDDPIIEGDEAFLIHFLTESGAAVGELTAVIVDDDCAITFAVDSAQVNEDDGVLELAVLRIGSPVQPVLVDFLAISGTAEAGVDFTDPSGTLTFLGNRFAILTNGSGDTVFLAGETNAILSIPIVNDPDGERDETFTVALHLLRSPGLPGTPPFLAWGPITNVTVTLLDNETPGRVDDSFQPGLGANAPVRTLAIQRDGKILAGGDFTTLDGVALARIGRLHADGLLDQSFNPGRGFDAPVHALLEQSDGRILVAGAFRSIDTLAQPFLARLEPDGTPSTGFDLLLDGPVFTLVSSPNRSTLVGGDFTRVQSRPQTGVARLQPDGSLDPTFAPGSAGRTGVRALAPLPDDLLLVGGSFESWGTPARRYLVRLLADGSPDPSFPPALSPNGPVRALLALADGSILIAGDFTTLGQVPRPGIGRLLPSGSVDFSFDPGLAANGPIHALAVQSDGRLIVTGAFDQFAGRPVGRFVRLDPDGTIDPSFFIGSGANDLVRAVAIQPNDAVVIGGDFTTVHERPRLRLARLHANEAFAEGQVEFAATTFSASESAAESFVQVRRNGSAKTAVQVAYRTHGGTATPGVDYLPAEGTLDFPIGVTQREFTVRLLDDTLAEGSETIGLALADPIGTSLGRIADSQLILEDNEAAVAFDLATVTVTEGDPAGPWILRRSGPLDTAATVHYRTEALTALPGLDFQPVAGVLEFPPGIAAQGLTVPILDDTAIEPAKSFAVHLESPSAGLALGTQSTLLVTLLDNDRPPTSHTLTLQPSPGGSVIPSGGRYPTNALVELRALPDPGFEFARWEGTIASADNPLFLLMDRNHVLAARFLPRNYLETFETGDFTALPWFTSGNAPWQVTEDSAATGRYAARSGRVEDRADSILTLEHLTGAGSGSFEFRTESERGWDFLEFRIDDQLIERWSGVLGWQTYTFNFDAGRHRFEWRFTRDATFGGTNDAVWIDNLDLPDPENAPPRLEFVIRATGHHLRIVDPAARILQLETSTDLVHWLSLDGTWSDADEIPLSHLTGTARFFRLRAGSNGVRP